jgi:hypothetical protein
MFDLGELAISDHADSQKQKNKHCTQTINKNASVFRKQEQKLGLRAPPLGAGLEEAGRDRGLWKVGVCLRVESARERVGARSMWQMELAFRLTTFRPLLRQTTV